MPPPVGSLELPRFTVSLSLTLAPLSTTAEPLRIRMPPPSWLSPALPPVTVAEVSVKVPSSTRMTRAFLLPFTVTPFSVEFPWLKITFPWILVALVLTSWKSLEATIVPPPETVTPLRTMVLRTVSVTPLSTTRSVVSEAVSSQMVSSLTTFVLHSEQTPFTQVCVWARFPSGAFCSPGAAPSIKVWSVSDPPWDPVCSVQWA